MIKNVGAQGWVSCPLGINLLLSLLKGSKADTEKYNQASIFEDFLGSSSGHRMPRTPPIEAP